MADDWFAEDVPFLRALVEMERERRDGPLPFPGDVAVRAGLPLEYGNAVAARLTEGGYLRSNIQRNGAGEIWLIMISAITADGRRAAGQWPSHDPVERLLELLERRIADEPDEQRKSRLVRVRDSVKDLSRDVGTNVVANLIVAAGAAGAAGLG